MEKPISEETARYVRGKDECELRDLIASFERAGLPYAELPRAATAELVRRWNEEGAPSSE